MRCRRRCYLTTSSRVMRPWNAVFVCTFLYCVLLTHRRYDFLQESEGRIKALQLQLQERAAKVRSACTAHPPPLTRMEQSAQNAAALSADMASHYYNLHMKAALLHMVYLPDQNLTWCLVPKVASSSWALALMQVEGVQGKGSRSMSPQVYLRNAHRVTDPQRVNQTITPSIKFLFVRHPFVRLVSAFRNKLEDSTAQEDGPYFYKTYGKHIVSRFRHNRKNDKRIKDSNLVNVDSVYRKEPTFLEFVDYLLDTDPADYDEHWRPVALHCHVCQFHFDFIIKYENFQEEINFLVDLLQEGGRLPSSFHLTWENKGGTDMNTTVRYLKQLDKEQLMQLFDKYRLDFLYFGYNTDGYTDYPEMDLMR